MGDLFAKAAVDGGALRADEHPMVDGGPCGV